MIWTFFIRPKILTYYIVCFKTFNSLKNGFKTVFIMSYIIDISVIIGLPLMSYIILKKHLCNLDTKEINIKYGSLYQNLNKNKSSVKTFISTQCIYRIQIALTSVFMQGIYCSSVITYIVCSVFYTSLVFF